MQYPASMRPGPVSHSAALEEILNNVLNLFALLLLGKLVSWLWRLRCSYFKKSPAARQKQQQQQQHLKQEQQKQQLKPATVAPTVHRRKHVLGDSVALLHSAADCVVEKCSRFVQSSSDPAVAVPKGCSMQDILADTQLRPKHSRRIRSREEFWSIVSIGQHYAVQRSLLGVCLFHHFLVSEVSPARDRAKVIHYNGTAWRYIETVKKVFGEVVENTVHHDDCDLLDIPLRLYVVDDPLYAATASASAASSERCRSSGGCAVATAEAAVARARRRLGECSYGMTYNNCEHFVRWALTGLPRCDQYDCMPLGHKVVGSLVDELPHFGFHLLFKVARYACYSVASVIETVVLEGGARLARHTAEASLPAVASTAAATAGLAAPAEAAYLAYRIIDMKRRLGDGTLSRFDYDNAKDKAITSAVLSLVCSTCGAVVGQLLVPAPLLGAVLGSFLGGVLGRLGGASIAAFGIGLKEQYRSSSSRGSS